MVGRLISFPFERFALFSGRNIVWYFYLHWSHENQPSMWVNIPFVPWIRHGVDRSSIKSVMLEICGCCNSLGWLGGCAFWNVAPRNEWKPRIAGTTKNIQKWYFMDLLYKNPGSPTTHFFCSLVYEFRRCFQRKGLRNRQNGTVFTNGGNDFQVIYAQCCGPHPNLEIFVRQ